MLLRLERGFAPFIARVTLAPRAARNLTRPTAARDHRCERIALSSHWV